MSNAGLTGLNDFSTGRGDVSNAQCSSLNVGEYPMKFKPCGSDGNVLLWQGDCVERQVILPPPLPCFSADTTKKYCDVSVSMSIPSFTFSAPAIVCRITGQIWPKGLEQSAILGCQNFRARGQWFLIYEIDGVQQLDAREGEVLNLDATLSVSIPTVTAPFGECVGRQYNIGGPCGRIPGLRLDDYLDWYTQAQQSGCNNADFPLLSDGTCAKLSGIKGCEILYAHKPGLPSRYGFEVTGSVGDSIGPSADNGTLIYSQNDSKFFGEYQVRLYDDREGAGHYVLVNLVISHNEALPGTTSLQGFGYFSSIGPVLIAGETYVYKTTENLFDYADDPAECARTITATLVSPGDVYLKPYIEVSASNQFGVAPTTMELTATIIRDRQLEPEYVGPDAGDRLKATWSLEYDIQEQLWTLHSFEQIENPIYTLRDTNPCCGESKVLTRVQNIGAQGCDISPETITISRGGDFFGGEVRRRTNIRSGCPRTTKRAACDCQDNVIDYRAATVAKCVDITTPGCEDYGDDVKTRFPKNQLHCPSCDRNSPCDPFLPEFVAVPCSYEALFGSGIGGKPPCNIIHDNTEIASGVVTMRQRCRFTNPCEWVAVGPSTEPLDGAVGHDPYCVLCAEFAVGSCASNCTWEAVQAGVCIPGSRPGLLKPPINILKKLGTSWHLEVAGGVGGMSSDLTHLYYNHPRFGMLRYRVSPLEPFLCDNVNTLHLEEQGNLPDGVMPESICVRPRYSGCGGSMTYDIKSDDYAEVEDQIACCDPACGSIGPLPIIVRCCFSLERCEATFTAQVTLLGRDSPAGPSYLGSCTLHGVLWTGVIYCDGVRWKTDWYCKSPREFFVTTTHTHTCCPLTLSVEYWPDNFGGVKCCPVQECKCCDTSGTDYDTLEMSITFSAACAADMFAALCTFSRPVTMTLTMTRVVNSTSSWTYILCDNDYGMDMFVSCLNGVWTFSWNFAGTPPFPLLIANCDNRTGSVTATNSALCPAILLEWTDPITCPNGNCVLVSNITITS
jgi:hypothetical protein